MSLDLLTIDQLCARISDGESSRDFSPFGRVGVVAVDLRGAGDGSRPKAASIRSWLAALPGLSLAIAAPAVRGELPAAFDVVASGEAEAEALITAAARAPIAATVLMQLLRAGDGLPTESALLAESLAYSTLQAGPEYRAWLAANRAEVPADHSDSGAAVLMERLDDSLSLALNRASNRNGMTVEMRDALIEALQLVLADDSIVRVSLCGLGRCFSTGGDLTEFGSAPDPATAHIVRSLALPGRLLAACEDRVTVRLHGACVGSGIEFPAFAGRLVATPDAWFQLPELKFGLIPGAGGTVSIARRIGRQRLAGWVLSGRRIDARTALAWGLIDAIED